MKATFCVTFSLSPFMMQACILCLHRQQNRSSQTGLTGTSSGFGILAGLCVNAHTPFRKARQPQWFDKVQAIDSVMCSWPTGCCCHSGINLARKYTVCLRQTTHCQTLSSTSVKLLCGSSTHRLFFLALLCQQIETYKYFMFDK